MRLLLKLFLFSSISVVSQTSAGQENITEKSYSLTAVGDIMIGTNYPSNSYLPPNDGFGFFDSVSEILNKSDITFGNLEGVIMSENISPRKRCKNPKNCYVFKMPDNYVNHIKNAGFNLLSIANNHINDFGSKGVLNTTKLLDESEISYAGTINNPTTIINFKGIKVGFCAFSPNYGTVNINNLKNAKKIVSNLNSKVDIVIVSFHAGGEGENFQHISNKNEIYLGENRGNPYLFARQMIDQGADIILGHGPHVTRAIDIYKNKFIAYSLGNFATYGRFSLRGPKGISPIVEIKFDNKGDFISGKITSVKLVNGGIPVIDKKNSALQIITDLVKDDLPESTIRISSNGEFFKD